MAETPAKSGANAPEFSVSELAGAIKRALEEGFGYVRLRGEVSGYRGPHSSGHCYFALKDDKSKIEAVIWRGVWGKLRIKPEEGMEVIATGKISSFPGSSKYQIVIEALEPAGLGALMVQLEERKKKLTAEGLFAPERKRPLPFIPRVVGIVTSPTGAVIRDMLHGFAERFPTHVVVWPVRVQGEGSAEEVARAIRGFNAILPGGRVPRPDVLIVARGGGSLEDLWGFNDEAVVRAVASSALPVISAVGHETDWTLIDLAADARAPTPTKAAEWAVPKHSELLAQSSELGARLRVGIRRLIEATRTHLKAAARGLPRPEDLVALPRQRFDAFDRRLGRALLANTRAHHTHFIRTSSRFEPRLLTARIERAERRLAEVAEQSRSGLMRFAGQRRTRLERTGGRLGAHLLAGSIQRADRRIGDLWQKATRALTRSSGERRTRLERIGGRLRADAVLTRIDAKRRQLEGAASLLRSLSYQSVLSRGFAIVRDGNGAMIRSAALVAAGQRLDIEFADGQVAADAVSAGLPHEPAEKAAAAPQHPASKPAAARKGGSGQGSLF